jgi:hypothetical protein
MWTKDWRGRRRRTRLRTRHGRRPHVEGLEPRALLAVLAVGPTAPYDTIQAAVDHAQPRDVISIASGTYAESVDLSRMGSAVGGGSGALTFRGSATAEVVWAAPSGAALFNASAFTGDLSVEQMTVQSPLGSGIQLHDIQGHLAIVDAVFSEIAATGLDVSGCSGGLSLTDSGFLAVGHGAGDNAVHLAGVDGAVTILRNTIEDAADTAVVLENSGSHQASVMIDGNTIRGDAVFFATTRRGVQAVLGDSTKTDLTLDGNQLEHLAAGAVAMEVAGQAELQTRWSNNGVTNVKGPAALDLQLAGTAEVAAAILVNSVTDAWDDGLMVVIGDAAQLRATIRGNAFSNVGDGPHDDALTVDAADSGTAALLIDNNDCATVTGIGLHLLARGQATLTAAVQGNVLYDINSQSGDAAVLIEQAAAEDQASIQVRLADNTVMTSAAQAASYSLRQRGSGTFSLEGVLADAAAQVAAANFPSDPAATTVEGTVQVVTPGAIDEALPLLLGDRVWLDQDGDGVQDSTEPGMGDVRLTLAGTEAGSGTLVQRETQTDTTGGYAFVGLRPGAYTLTLQVPQGYQIAQPLQGADRSLDSDFAPASMPQAAVSLAAAQDELTIDAGLLNTWQNPRDPHDVNDDGFVTPLDVLLIVNDLNVYGFRALVVPPLAPTVPPPFLDVDKDGVAEPLDVLLVINYLNVYGAGVAAGEGEAANPAANPAPDGVPSSVAAPAPTPNTGPGGARAGLRSRSAAWESRLCGL